MGLVPKVQFRSEKVDPVHPKDTALIKMFGLNRSNFGVNVDSDNALEVVAVMACVKVIAETMASLPFVLYRRRADGGKDKARDHYLFELLRYQPNRWQSWFDFCEMMAGHIMLRGNAYALKVFERSGRIKELVPIHPDRVLVFRAKNGDRAYAYTPRDNAEQQILLQEELFHVPGLSFDGLAGLDPIEYARNAIGLSKAAEEFGGRFFQNDARPGIILKHEKQLSPEAVDRLRESWEERFGGVKKSHKPVVLEDNMDIKEIGVAPDNAQFLETRKFQKAEIAGFFRVPSHLINDLEKATFSNIENMGRQFVDYTLLPWFVRFEQAARMQLLTTAEKKAGYFAEIEPAALLRGDLKSRYEAYGIGRNWGWLSVNEIRRKENMNPIDEGDVYLQPLNMTGAGDPPENNSSDGTKLRKILPVLDAAASRVVQKEVKALRRSLEKPDFDDFLDNFYKEHRDFVSEVLGVSAVVARSWCEEQLSEIRYSVSRKEILDSWEADNGKALRQMVLEHLDGET
jgi:HK97 family phage portal protein